MHTALGAEVCPSIDLHLQRNRNTHTLTIGANKAQSLTPRGFTALVNKPLSRCDVFLKKKKKVVFLNFNSHQEEGKSGCRAF